MFIPKALRRITGAAFFLYIARRKLFYPPAIKSILMMQKAILTLACLFTFLIANAQSQVITNSHGRRYLVNKEIEGVSAESTDVTYLLLHKAYNGTLLDDHYVMGKISGLRGATWAWNRKWTIEVNTATAYGNTRGSLISYNEASSLVTLTYSGERYLAASIANTSSLSAFSFTGYAQNEAFLLVTGAQVSNVEMLNSGDELTFQGRMTATGPGADINVGNASQLSDGLVVMAKTPSRHATRGAQLEFAIPSDGSGNFWGQGRIITIAGNANQSDASGKMVLGTRRVFNKQGTGVQWYYGDDIVIDAAGNVGIGTLNPQAKLAVKGDVFAQKVKVTLSGWSDFVFDPSYKLPSLYEMEKFIRTNRHLPGIPTEAEVKEKGIDVGEMNKLLLQKIEEQMLYIIELRKEVDALKQGQQVR